MSEQPEQSYYPGWKVRLIVRFDEFGRTELVKSKAPTKIVTKLKGTKDSRGTLTVKAETDEATGLRRFVLASAATPALAGPQKETSSADDLTHVVEGIIPREMTWGSNGIRTANTLKVDLKYVDMPIDPRVVRSCAIEGYIGTVTAEEFARQVDNGAVAHVIPDTWVDANGLLRSNKRFSGWVDTWEVEWPEGNEEPAIHFECRDNTTMLIDQEAPPKLHVDEKLPIDEAVATYLSNFPQMAGLHVQYRPGGAVVPKLGDAMSSAFKPTLGPTKGGAGGGSSKLSVWDYLTDVAGALGHIVSVDDTTVVVQRVRTLMSNQFTARPDDPFQTRTLSSGLVLDRRNFIYGRNVQSMKVSRKFSKSAPANVEVRCYNAARKKVLVVRFPIGGTTPGSKGDQSIVSGANPGDGKSEQKYLVWRVSGIEDEATLRVVAQSIYESVGRNELACSIRTKNLASFGGGNLDPDLLDMRQGDSVELLINRGAGATQTKLEQTMLVADSGAALLEAVGYGRAFAEAYGKAYSDAGFQTAFRVRGMTVSCSRDDSVQVEVQCVNYVEARVDRQLPAGEETVHDGPPNEATSRTQQPEP